MGEEKKPKTDGFRILPSYYEAIRNLPDTERLLLWDAIMDYGFGNDVEDLPPMLRACFTLLEPVIKKSVEYYQTQKKNGKKGGRPPKAKRNPNETQRKPNQKHDSDYEPDNDIEPDCDNETDIGSDADQGENEPENFIFFWQAYPKKVNRQKALDAFREIEGTVDFSTLYSALSKQKNLDAWEETRFIPNPENWLRNRRWEDEIEDCY